MQDQSRPRRARRCRPRRPCLLVRVGVKDGAISPVPNPLMGACVVCMDACGCCGVVNADVWVVCVVSCRPRAGASPSTTPSASATPSMSSRASVSPSSSPSTVQWTSWHVGEWSPCSQFCGLSGVRHRVVTCVQQTAAGSVPTDPAACYNLQVEKPAESEDCFPDPCPALYWRQPALWSRCSIPCMASTSGRSEPGRCRLACATPLGSRQASGTGTTTYSQPAADQFLLQGRCACLLVCAHVCVARVGVSTASEPPRCTRVDPDGAAVLVRTTDQRHSCVAFPIVPTKYLVAETD